MFQSLADSLDKSFRNLRGVGKISESNIADALRDIRLALLEADVEFSVARDFINRIKEKAVGVEVLKSIKPGEQVVKIFHDELAALLGGDHAPLNLNPPARILLCGLNGAGKTTTAAKLAYRLKKEGRRPVLVAIDLYRPAAIEQLATLAKQVDVPCYTPDSSEKDLVKVAKDALKWAETQDHSVIIFDTAGRQELDDSLIGELKKLHQFLAPRETLLVADSAAGQQAVSVATHFNDAVGITGIILTEGEKIDQLGEFHPSRMADRILGMGDIVSMVEQVADKINEADAMRSAQRMAEGKFDFSDFLDQMKMIQNMGPLEGLLGLMPGFSKIKKQLPANALDGKKLKRTEAIVLSMTRDERQRPEIIRGTRRKRIADGSGTSLQEVNALLKQFGQMREMMRSPHKMKNMMKAMSGESGGPGDISNYPRGFGKKR